MRKILIALGLTAVFAATSCTPQQLDIDITIRDRVVLKTLPDGSQTVTVTGIQMCTGGSRAPKQGEHLDIWIQVRNTNMGQPYNGTGIGDHDGLNQSCNVDPTVYTTTWTIEPENGESLEVGRAIVKVEACTNPGERIDEDCSWSESIWGDVVAG